MQLPSSDRIPFISHHSASVATGRRVIGVISIDESFACRLEAEHLETPWEILISDWATDQPTVRCEQLVADLDRLAKELAAEFAAIQ